MNNERPRSLPWVVVSIVTAALFAGLLCVALWVPDWPGTLILCSAIVVFILVLRRNPEYWYRRSAEFCLGAGLTSGLAPHVNARVHFSNQQFADLVVDNSDILAPTFVVAAGVFGLFDLVKHHPELFKSFTFRRYQASRDIVVVEAGGTYNHFEAANAGIVDEWLHTLKKECKDEIQQYQVEVDSLKKQLNAALTRVAAEASAGKRSAKEAIEQAHQSKDPKLVQEFLSSATEEAKRNHLDSTSSYVELCLETAAIAYLRRDFDAAEHYIQAVMEIDADNVVALNRLADIRFAQDRWAEATTILRRVVAKSSDLRRRGRAHGNLGHLLMVQGEPEQAEPEFREELQISENLKDPEGIAIGHMHLGTLFINRGKLTEAKIAFRRALESAQSIPNSIVLADCNTHLGLIELQTGDLDAANSFLKKALEIDKLAGDLERAADDWTNLALVARARGDLHRAETMHCMALELNRELKRESTVADCLSNLGVISQYQGRWDDAETKYRESIEIYQRLGLTPSLADQYGNLANVLLKKGQIAEAESLLHKSIALYERVGGKRGEGNAYASLGLVSFERGELANAEQYLLQALTMHREAGFVEPIGVVLANLGQVAKSRGDHAMAKQYWTEARNIFLQLGNHSFVASLQQMLDALTAR